MNLNKKDIYFSIIETSTTLIQNWNKKTVYLYITWNYIIQDNKFTDWTTSYCLISLILSSGCIRPVCRINDCRDANFLIHILHVLSKTIYSNQNIEIMMRTTRLILHVMNCIIHTKKLHTNFRSWKRRKYRTRRRISDCFPLFDSRLVQTEIFVSL